MKRRKVLLIVLATIIWHLGSTSDAWIYQSYIQALSYAARLVVRPDSSIVPADTRVSFFCRADGNPMPNVVWRRNGHIVQDPRYITKSLPNGLSTLRIEPVKLIDHNSTISCSADNGVGAPVTADALLTVLQEDDLPNGFPVIEAHPSLKSVEQGRTAHVTCRVKGDPRPKVLWLRDLMPIDVRSHNRYSVSTLGNPEYRMKSIGALMIQQAREEDQGRYECVARNSHGVIHSKAAHLYVKVRRVPPYFTYKLEKSYKVGLGGSVNLTCVAVGYPMPRVFWKRKSDDSFLNDPHSAPIGKNVLTLTNVDQTENYTCHAVSRLGDIEASTTVEVKALPPSPKNLRISEVTPSSVRLTWDPLKLDSEPVKKYLIRYRQKISQNAKTYTASPNRAEYAESGAHREKEVPAASNSLLISNLEPYTQYEFSILAISSIGRGTLSNPVETQTGEIAPTSPPVKIQARALNRNSILVRWDPPDKPNGQITGYKVYYTNEEPSTPHPLWKTKETKADELMTTLYNLVAESTYYIQIQARNAQGSGPMSKTATVITKHGIPGQPAGLKARPLDSKRVELSWEKPLHSFNIVGYTIFYNASRAQDREITLTSPVEKVVIDRLDPDTFYAFKVAAQSTRGLGAFCEEVVARTHQSVPTAAPNVTNLTTVSSTELRLEWEAPEESARNGVLTEYLIRWWPLTATNPTAKANPLDFESDESDVAEAGENFVVKGAREVRKSANESTNLIIPNLEPYTIYEVTIAAGTAKGFGPSSEPQQQRTGEDADYRQIPAPSEPRNIEVVLVNASAVKVSWERPARTNGDLIGYYIFKEKLENGEPIGTKLQTALAIYDANKTSALIAELEPNTEYSFRVSALNRQGDGEYSEAKSIMTGGLPPSEPITQSVSLLSDEPPLRARIEWMPPKITYNMPISKYVVWYRPAERQSFQQMEVPGTQTFVEINNLLMGREYIIKVAAANDDGLSQNATESLITPAGIPDSEPLNVRYDVADQNMTVTWDPPAVDQRNGNITYYRAVLTPFHPGEKRMEMNVTGRSATFPASPKKAYSFRVAAATMKGLGPYSPVLNIDPNPSASRQTTAQAHGIETEDIGDGDTYDEEYRISTAEYFDAIVNAGLPGPLQLPTVPAAPDEEAEELVPMSSSSSWLRNVVVNSEPAADEQALVGPPTNVRVQATSNSSAVVQWDFEEGGPDGGVADGFVIKYIHEPVNGQSDSERWRSQVVMDSKARHLEIAQLTVHKPYAFCVLAIKQKRQGQCSDPPITIENLQPVHMVSNLHVHTKTSNQVELAWDYSGPQNIQFYIKQTGSKKYIDQHLEEKEMVAPGYHKEANEHDRRLVWDNLRPYMEYRFQVGVRDLSGGTEFWPREVTVRTDSAGPPFVDKPEFIESRTSETALLKLRCASEEYGPISHYWLIVVPGNFTQEDMVKLTSSKADMLTRATALKRPLSDAGDDIGVVAKKKMRTTEGVTIRSKTKRYSSDTPSLDGVYIAAGLSASEMQQMTRNNRNFVLGDGKTYDGYRNHPLEPNSKYRLMMRAFARQERSDQPFKYARPMHEPPSPKYTDSTLSDIFSTKSSPMTRGARSSNIWLLGPIIAVVVILIIVGMLVFWWLRGKKKGIPHGANRHGSITKVALGGINNGMPTETSKLLLGTDAYGRPVMNPYEMSNGGNMGRDNIDMYPMGNGISNYPPVPVPMMSSSGAGIGSHAYVHPPIPISELPAHIDKLKMNNNALFSQEYESIETGQHFTWEHSSMEMNKAKNRYANVVAYDHSRVILSSIDDIPGSDYINANYIDGYERTKTYIATQGPLPETFADFWRMVWEERSATIVMLTKLEERSRIKCDQYWPSRNSSVYGRIQVTLVDTLTLAHYTIRTFTIEHRDEKECREIKHLQYTAWPDHGVPDHPTPFLMFLKRVRTLNDPEAGPIISHCSAGIGRTGAFIVIDCMLERLRYESTVDIFGCVTSLRSQRSYMVQTDDQYVFIHDAVLDAVQSGSTEVPASKLFGHIQMLHQHQNYDRVSGLELEFRTLGTLRNLNSRCDVGNLPINRPKNRTAMIVPFDTTRVVLQMIPTVEGSDYINASWIDGYTQRNAYIGTQAPLPNTVSDFWRMVWEQESSIIAMLNSSNEFGTGRHQEMFCQYWPSESSSKFGSIVVEPVAEYNMTQYVLREFKMTDTLTGYSRTVRHFEFTEWPDHGVPTSGEVFIDFINQVHRTKQQFGVDGPICVHCTTGTGRTGVFIALSIIIERMQLEQVVDVFTTVKLLRTERMNMVDDSAQYEFCYQAAGDFLKLNAFDSPYLMQ